MILKLPSMEKKRVLLSLFRVLFLYQSQSLIFFLVFPSVPAAPGLLCLGEDKSFYRRGARRWRKLYRVNGHLFQAEL